MKIQKYCVLLMGACLAGSGARADTLVRFDFTYATTTSPSVVNTTFAVYADIYSQPTASAANFLSYVNSGAYNDSFIHRSVPGFVLQGGGFKFDSPSVVDYVTTNAAIPFQYTVPNTRGTIAYARTSDPNSATSQFFFNLADNSTALGPGGSDPNGYAVFGNVLNATSMSYVDQMAGIPVYDASSYLGSNFTQLPLTQPSLGYNYFLHLTDVANLGLIGDLNGDGKINIDDFVAWDTNYLHHNSGWGANNYTGYAMGDLNLDGTIDASDYGLLINAYNQSRSGTLGSADLALQPVGVPEPASLAMLACAGMALLRRKRRL